MTSPVSAIEAIEKAMEGVTHPDAPEWIAVAQDGDGPNGGFWTCAAATTESPRYIRADIYAALARQAEALQRERSAAETDILAERHRQIEVEGWTAEHDDAHRRGELAGAAACYVVDGLPSVAKIAVHRSYWDWDSDWWKPSDHRRNLVKAAALIIAEIERLDRARALLGGSENAE